MSNLLIIRAEAARAFVTNGLPKGRAWSSLTYAYDYEVENAMYLGWFDDNPKKTPAEKISEARAAYVARFGTAPNIILVNEADWVEVAGVVIRTEGYIRRNNFWVGWEDGCRA